MFTSAKTWDETNVSYFQWGRLISRPDLLHKSFIKTLFHHLIKNKRENSDKDPVGANRLFQYFLYYKEELTLCMRNMLIDISRKNSNCRDSYTDSESSHMWSEIIHHWKFKRHFILCFGKGYDSLRKASVMLYKV